MKDLSLIVQSMIFCMAGIAHVIVYFFLPHLLPLLIVGIILFTTGVIGTLIICIKNRHTTPGPEPDNNELPLIVP